MNYWTRSTAVTLTELEVFVIVNFLLKDNCFLMQRAFSCPQIPVNGKNPLIHYYRFLDLNCSRMTGTMTNTEHCTHFACNFSF